MGFNQSLISAFLFSIILSHFVSVEEAQARRRIFPLFGGRASECRGGGCGPTSRRTRCDSGGCGEQEVLSGSSCSPNGCRVADSSSHGEFTGDTRSVAAENIRQTEPEIVNQPQVEAVSRNPASGTTPAESSRVEDSQTSTDENPRYTSICRAKDPSGAKQLFGRSSENKFVPLHISSTSGQLVGGREGTIALDARTQNEADIYYRANLASFSGDSRKKVEAAISSTSSTDSAAKVVVEFYSGIGCGPCKFFQRELSNDSEWKALRNNPRFVFDFKELQMGPGNFASTGAPIEIYPTIVVRWNGKSETYPKKVGSRFEKLQKSDVIAKSQFALSKLPAASAPLASLSTADQQAKIERFKKVRLQDCTPALASVDGTGGSGY